jgi:transcriptional regulator with XRE-family HTH domain
LTLHRLGRIFPTEMTGPEIRAAREARGWTQLELAQAIGVAFETVCRWEQGKLGLRRTSEVALRAVLRDDGKAGSKRSRKTAAKS